jgi:hypothetical protein
MDHDLQGSIEKFTLPEIFQLIAASRKSGTLGIQKDESIVMVYFRDGDIIYGYGPRQTFHLGQLLKDRGKLTGEQLEEAIAIQARTENTLRLGEILIRQQFINGADLEKVITEQIEELLYSLLAWQTGSFKFYENQFPTEEEITVKLSVENVILEGLRRLDEMNLAKDVLEDFENVYTISASQGGRARAVTMEADEWNVMALVDGRRSVNEICKRSSLPTEDGLRVMAKLKLAGIITKTEARPESQPADSRLEQMTRRLAGLFEDYLSTPHPQRTVERRITETMLEGDES